eukprot:scaffold17615_cov107-Isochrysis_galbana.AAC.3
MGSRVSGVRTPAAGGLSAHSVPVFQVNKLGLDANIGVARLGQESARDRDRLHRLGRSGKGEEVTGGSTPSK